MKKSIQQDVAELIGKMQEQLASMERKIDSLINRPTAQPQQAQFRPPRHNDRPQHGHGGNDFRQRSMYKVICAECNKQCEIPFKPRNDRPVYCKDCFLKRRNSGDSFKPEQKSTFIERDFTQDRPSGKKKRPSGKKKSRRK